MNEKPLERLNYYNGMPLQASDFKTEQDYHMRTRRWLNKSLYSAGIARGLEVRDITEGPKIDTPYVAVSPGLALDSEGREIILFDEALVEVCSYSGTNESTVVGNYLVIEYAEETLAYESGGCAVRTPGTSASKSTNQWGGPSRIQARVKFSWAPFVPQPGSNQIVLARVELKPGCGQVHQIDAGARRNIGAASAAMVRQYALEGERHIDKDNPGRIYFHIRGRQPNSVTLYLRAEKFSTLYYTEMGQHLHTASVSGAPVTEPAISVDPHSHLHTLTVGVDSHKHRMTGLFAMPITDPRTRSTVNNPRGWYALAPVPRAIIPLVNKSVDVEYLDDFLGMETMFENQGDLDQPSGHGHTLEGKIGSTVQPNTGTKFHTHALGTYSSSVQNAGVSDVQARTQKNNTDPDEKALTYVDNLQVFIGLDNKTPDILGQLRDAQQGITWDKLGNGTAGHVLAVEGTRAIRLDFLPGVTFSEGREYVIDLRVPNGGGRILYNLYVE